MRSSSFAASGLAVLVTCVLCYGGCNAIPFIGGKCEVSSDCQSDFQYAADTHCVGGRCVCREPDERVCCAKGEEGPECFLRCLPCAECGEAPGTTDGGCPPVTPECVTVADCPGPPEPRCGTGVCVDGTCQIEFRHGPMLSQRRGDCRRSECTADGAVAEVDDPTDVYNDGEQCTTDTCEGTSARNEDLADGTICPEAGAGVCVGGRCVACWDLGWSQMCGLSLACDSQWCVPGHCVNTTFDPALGETGEDCGGPCRPCTTGTTCGVGADCYTGVCSSGTCQVPTCVDGVRNDAESGLDCGAPSCPLCAVGQGCRVAWDCTAGVCWAGVCEGPTCFDGVQNGQETGVDCGADCLSTCP